MRVTIVGAGPVGLLLACLLAPNHIVTILEKRINRTRGHSLNIDTVTIKEISDFAPNNKELQNILNEWKTLHGHVNTVDIEESLLKLAISSGVIILEKEVIDTIDDIPGHVIIGADGSHSKIRSIVFNDEIMDRHTVDYMVQLKYQTPEGTKPRQDISAMVYSFINSFAGSDIVTDFESLAPPKQIDPFDDNVTLRKAGVLHIPVPETVYNIITHNNRGTFRTPWLIDELAQINNEHIARLLRIIRRYEFSLKWRGGWLEDAKITAIPLTIYRSTNVVRITENNKLIILVGDASSGLIYQRGLNKGWMEAIQCARTLLCNTVETLTLGLRAYSQYCLSLYEDEKIIALEKHEKILHANKTAATISSSILQKFSKKI